MDNLLYNIHRKKKLKIKLFGKKFGKKHSNNQIQIKISMKKIKQINDKQSKLYRRTVPTLL